ncbi:hypothetical protein Poli38472_006509 [Pythium oligandrum]|uniref:Metallo-beta-lactamase domain-containing protein n=1 Tax=Pythium oligandrum TaxID=41045 RepID=A0A8K1C4Q8_PYTOL|nr:hypothetical protein Poli38472_006509 [Pythium oligandrum]|eukprot:TMW56499.1 hypothetical protein Poli38472_006509 [Pythium oligandrum]
MEVVVLGCGPSSSVPALRCVLQGSCAVCMEAHRNADSKNRRLNPSLLVRDTKRDVNILIDCGKTFRESMLRVFPALQTKHVDALVLTHGHADACLGMDDLREVQKSEQSIDPNTGEAIKKPQEPMGLHCSAATQAEMGSKFEYLMESEKDRADREANVVAVPFRWVAKLKWEIFDWFQPFQVRGFQFTPFPVVHGKGYLSTAFEFGAEFGVRIVYISDVSEFTEETCAYLNDTSRGPVNLLVIDCLYVDQFHSTHMNLENVAREIRTIRPKLTLLTGMSHKLDYEQPPAMLEQLKTQDGLDVRMAFDGLRLAFPPTSNY